MGFTDLLTDFYSAMTFTEAHAEAPAADEQESDDKADESSEDGGEEKSEDAGDDKEDGGDDEAEGGDDEGGDDEDDEEEEEEEEEEPEDPKPKFEEGRECPFALFSIFCFGGKVEAGLLADCRFSDLPF